MPYIQYFTDCWMLVQQSCCLCCGRYAGCCIHSQLVRVAESMQVAEGIEVDVDSQVVVG